MVKWKLAILASAIVTITNGVTAGSVAAQSEDKPYHYVRVWYTDYTRTKATGQETLYCDNTYEMTGYVGEVERYFNGSCP